KPVEQLHIADRKQSEPKKPPGVYYCTGSNMAKGGDAEPLSIHCALDDLQGITVEEKVPSEVLRSRFEL
ncbi:hypothetical protein RUND412_002919, partial [Rhizina undulata]